jgi:hypothetical protein
MYKKMMIVMSAFALSFYTPSNAAASKKVSKPYTQRHIKVQQEFIQLQKGAGMPVPSNEVITQGVLCGRACIQTHIDILRTELNSLLGRPRFSPRDVQIIKEKIAELKRLNPTTWPLPADYEQLLAVKVSPVMWSIPGPR